MNLPKTLPDTQRDTDSSGIRLSNAGIKDLVMPGHAIDIDGFEMTTVMNWTMSADVQVGQRGTHMSRFVEIIHGEKTLRLGRLAELTEIVTDRLKSSTASLAVSFVGFVPKTAPVSNIHNLMHVNCTYGAQRAGNGVELAQRVTVPVTSLCPCSKNISDFGAHNQRADVVVSITGKDLLPVREICAIAESEASSALYSILKREDEKFVTEKAYNNPKFVEDITRGVYQAVVNTGVGIESEIDVEVTSYESIHNHNAWAAI